jgi:hypothetical protein
MRAREAPMTLFDFVTVMVSMILALSLGHLLDGISHLYKTRERVRWRLPHTLGRSRDHAHFRKQEWTAIGIDFVIVVIVVVGIQLGNWCEAQAHPER